ncbi:MAG: fumarylacetoacetate hydrolase family protein [Pseudomonadota bacterium]
MRLVRFRHDGRELLGVTDGRRISSITDRVADGLHDMNELIARWDELRANIESIENQTDAILADVELLAPVSRPGKIWGIGFNYLDHGSEAGVEAPEHQTWFAMAQTTVAGPFQAIELPVVSSALDYEAELVAIVGTGGRHIPSDEADKAIFGYCCGNDVSVRDWQLRSGQHSIGKSFDGHAPIGPWIVTADEVDPENLAIRALVNGDIRQDSNTRHQIFKPAEQMAHLSCAMTMEPGDLLFTGTPAGVGALMSPPCYLHEGDVVRIEIDGIGAIENHVVREGVDPQSR